VIVSPLGDTTQKYSYCVGDWRTSFLQERHNRRSDNAENEAMKQNVKQRQIAEENNKNGKKKEMKRHIKGNEASEKVTTLMNQHQLDTLFLVCLLRVNASTCFGRYSPIFRRLCTGAIWCNYVRRMCVDCVQVAVLLLSL
jgi:hypothetical protein